MGKTEYIRSRKHSLGTPAPGLKNAKLLPQTTATTWLTGYQFLDHIRKKRIPVLAEPAEKDRDPKKIEQLLPKHWDREHYHCLYFIGTVFRIRFTITIKKDKKKKIYGKRPLFVMAAHWIPAQQKWIFEYTCLASHLTRNEHIVVLKKPPKKKKVKKKKPPG